jgi:cell division septation protein DedD
MSDDLKFSIQRTRALVLAGCFAAVSVLLFFAGTVTGLLYSGAHAETTLVVSAPAAPARPHSTPDKTPEAPTDAAAASFATPPPDKPTPSSGAPAAATTPPAAPPAPSTATAKTPPATAASSAAPGTTGAQATAPPPTKLSSADASDTASETEPSLTIPLAVQVGAFAVKSNAETLVQSLGDMGYKPVVSRSTDAHGHQWYVVRIGPYTKWNAASRVAARISTTEDVTPVIGPMR